MYYGPWLQVSTPTLDNNNGPFEISQFTVLLPPKDDFDESFSSRKIYRLVINKALLCFYKHINLLRPWLFLISGRDKSVLFERYQLWLMVLRLIHLSAVYQFHPSSSWLASPAQLCLTDRAINYFYDNWDSKLDESLEPSCVTGCPGLPWLLEPNLGFSAILLSTVSGFEEEICRLSPCCPLKTKTISQCVHGAAVLTKGPLKPPPLQYKSYRVRFVVIAGATKLVLHVKPFWKIKWYYFFQKTVGNNNKFVY